MFDLKYFISIFSIALGILFGLEPFANSILAIMTPIGLIVFSQKMKKRGFGFLLGNYFVIAFCVSLIAFPWVFTGIRNITGTNVFLASLYFLVYSFLSNIKILFFFVLIRFIFQYSTVSSIWIYSIVALLSDLLIYQLFPWFYGNLSVGSIYEIQIASLFGVYFLSFTLFLKGYIVFVLSKLLLFYHKRKGLRTGLYKFFPLVKKVLFSFKHKLFKHTSFAFLIVLAVYIWGTIRYYSENSDKSNRTLKVAIIQANTARAVSAKRDDFVFVRKALTKVLQLGLEAIVRTEGKLDLLILPESAVPFHGTNDDQENKKSGIYSITFHSILAFLSKYGQQTIVYNEMERTSGELYNLESVFGLEGRRTDFYRKQLLLPIGEFIPFEEHIPILRKLFPETGFYKSGKKHKLLRYSHLVKKDNALSFKRDDLKQLNDMDSIFFNWPKYDQTKDAYFLPLICYEGMHPELVRDFFRQDTREADFIINLTNDSWFGDYLENYQHSSAVRFRAIETGLYVVRATLSGFSSFISPKGEYLLKSKDLGIDEILVQDIPIQRQATLYKVVGNFPVYFIGLALLFVCIKFRKVSGS